MYDIIYDDTRYVRRNKFVSILLMLKYLSTVPFNAMGVYDPSLINRYPWILTIETNDFDARIFYVLGMHRNLVQYYCARHGNGIVQQKFLYIEAMFDIGIVGSFLYTFYPEIDLITSRFFVIHSVFAFCSMYSVILLCFLKMRHLA